MILMMLVYNFIKFVMSDLKNNNLESFRNEVKYFLSKSL